MTALLILVFLITLLIGVPVAFSIALSAISVMAAGDVNMGMMIQRMFTSTDTFSLIAVPFFILAGDLLAQGAISKYLVSFAESFLGVITVSYTHLDVYKRQGKRSCRLGRSA